MSRVQGVPLDSYLKRIQACKSQDSAGGIGRILRVVPNSESPCCRDRLPTQIPVPISAAESWDLQHRRAIKGNFAERSHKKSSRHLLKCCPASDNALL